MTTDEERELRAAKEQRELKSLRQRVQFLEARAAQLESFLYEDLSSQYYDANNCQSGLARGMSTSNETLKRRNRILRPAGRRTGRALTLAGMAAPANRARGGSVPRK